MLHILHTQNRGERHADLLVSLPQHLVMPGFSETEQATKAVKELIHVIKNPGPQTPFTIGDIQLHSINRLAKLFNTMQPDTTHTIVVPS